jgi:hypothetical protein
MMLRRFLLLGLLASPAIFPADAPQNLRLFLLIGQSNMAGRGAIEPQDREPIPRVLMLNKAMEWVPAVDPMHFDKPEVIGVGIGRSFARLLAQENPSVTIGLIPAAFGGTSLDEWKPGDKLYKNAVERTKFALKSGKLSGILWHQGEADSNDEAKARSYRERFTAFVQTLREDLGAPDVPVVVGELGEYLKSPYSKIVSEQLAIIPLSVPHTAFVSSAGLHPKSDIVHFDTPSLREFGRRYALAFLSLDSTWNTIQ